MPSFSYSARMGGELVNGVKSAGSSADLARELQAAGMLPLRIESVVTAAPREKISLFQPKVALGELILFSHQMASLMRAGISVVRSVRTLAESAKSPVLREVLYKVATNLEGGLDVASSLGKHPKVFGELYVSLVHVGENTGRLDTAFTRIAQYLEQERETKRRINSATRYPSFVLGAMAIAVVVLNVFVIPAFATVFAKYGADLPWQTRAIVAVSNVFATYWPIMLGVGGVSVWGIYRYIQTPEGRLNWHKAELRIPILGSIFTRIYLARFCQVFAMVSRAGVPLDQGLNIVSRAIGNDSMARKVSGMRSSIERGESITATARAANLFSPVVLQMMAVGEETGTMDELLEQAAHFYEEEVDYELKGLTDALEPILIVGIAVLVLIMALGVFLPLWDLNSVAN